MSSYQAVSPGLCTVMLPLQVLCDEDKEKSQIVWSLCQYFLAHKDFLRYRMWPPQPFIVCQTPHSYCCISSSEIEIKYLESIFRVMMMLRGSQRPALFHPGTWFDLIAFACFVVTMNSVTWRNPRWMKMDAIGSETAHYVARCAVWLNTF